jgi:hypothetical protein
MTGKQVFQLRDALKKVTPLVTRVVGLGVLNPLGAFHVWNCILRGQYHPVWAEINRALLEEASAIVLEAMRVIEEADPVSFDKQAAENLRLAHEALHLLVPVMLQDISSRKTLRERLVKYLEYLATAEQKLDEAVKAKKAINDLFEG